MFCGVGVFPGSGVGVCRLNFICLQDALSPVSEIENDRQFANIIFRPIALLRGFKRVQLMSNRSGAKEVTS